ncbi:ankyrin repeat-containing domain protein [Jackrogersella minutella]|nr:ankyrin repeat-containing domain protein [Jackrogersella minutella]
MSKHTVASVRDVLPLPSRTTFGGQRIPDDVLYYIADNFITSFQDLCNLRLTCRTAASLVEGPLYRLDVRWAREQEYMKRHPVEKPIRVQPTDAELGIVSRDGRLQYMEDGSVYDPYGRSGWYDHAEFDIEFDSEDEEDDESNEEDDESNEDDDESNEDDDESNEDEHYNEDLNGNEYDDSALQGDEPVDTSLSARWRKHKDRLWLDCPATALHFAAFNGFEAMTQAIIHKALKFDPRYLDAKAGPRGHTAIQKASEGQNIEIVRSLIDAGAFVDASLSTGGTYYSSPLMSRLYDADRSKIPLPTSLVSTMLFGMKDVAILLAQHTEHIGNASQSFADNYLSPLIVAAHLKMPEVVQILLCRGQSGAINDTTSASNYVVEEKALSYAAMREDNHEIIDLLIAHGARLDCKEVSGRTPIEWAISCECFSNALYLLGREKPAYVGERIKDALSRTLEDKFLPITKVLAERFNTYGCFKILQSAFCTIVHDPKWYWEKHPKVTKYFIKLLALELNRAHLREGQQYLHWLLEQPEIDHSALKFILNEACDHIDVNASDAEGFTPLDYAIKHEHEEAVGILKDYGATAGQGTSE